MPPPLPPLLLPAVLCAGLLVLAGVRAMTLHVNLTKPAAIPVASVTVILTAQTASTTTLAAIVADVSGNQLLGRTVTWSSNDTSIAVVDASGYVTEGGTAGTATITATCEGITGTMTVTVSVPASVATTFVWEDPAPAFTAFGQTAYSRAVVKDQYGAVMTGYTITYTSGTPADVTVGSSTGLCTAVANGSSLITAQVTGTVGGIVNPSLTQTATVSQTVASITGVSSTLSALDTDSGSFSPVGKDANNNTVSGATFAYAVDFASILSVDSSGDWAGQSAGTAHVTITASPGGATFVVTATVTHATLTIASDTSPIYIGNSFNLTVQSSGTTVTPDTLTSSDTSKVTVDPPTIGTLSPTSITPGASNVAFTLAGCTNLRQASDTFTLPSGVTLSSYTVTGGGTGATFNLSATAGATVGAGTFTISNTGHGSASTALTVTSASGMGTLPITSGLVLRLHANAGVATSGSNVTSWTDQSSTGAVFSQATGANQPTLVANAYNSKPCLRFSGGQWLLTGSVLSVLNPGSPFTLYIVAKMTGTSTTDRILVSSRDSTAHTGYAIAGLDHNGTIQFYDGDGTTNQATGVATPDTTTLHGYAAMLNTSVGTKQTVYQDGTQKNTNAVSFAANTTVAACVGSDSANPSGTNLATKADITEILLYTGAHNATQVGQLHTYFQSEWGTP